MVNEMSLQITANSDVIFISCKKYLEGEQMSVWDRQYKLKY